MGVKLSKTEEQIMELIWQHGPVFMKELTEMLPELAPSTIATFLKRMQKKGFVGYKMFGNSRQYFPLEEKESYFKDQVSGIIRDFFNDSPLQFASFFTESADLSEEELKQLRSIVEKKIKTHQS